MKNNYLKVLTVFSLLVIVFLQTLWLCNTYSLIGSNMNKEINQILKQSMEAEVMHRLKNTPKGTRIECKNTSDEVSQMIALEEGLAELGYAVSLEYIDSVSFSLLKKYQIENDYRVCLVSPKTNEVLLESKEFQSSWTDIKSKIIPIKSDYSQGLQLILINPYKTIFERMILILIATAIMLGFIYYVLFILRKTIIKERDIAMHKDEIAKLRKDFSNAMIHNMRTPLGTVKMCNTLLSSGKIDENLDLKKKYFNRIDDTIKELISLTDQVLTLFKSENDKIHINYSVIDLPSLVDCLIDKYTIKTNKPIQFIVDLKASTMVADKDYLKEVLSNLIDNSIKYSKDSIKITITSTEDEYGTMISVIDNGIGISENELPIIFDPFKRGTSVEFSSAGFGLGLNYVAHIIQAHDGKITINSRENEFTEISLFIPKNKVI